MLRFFLRTVFISFFFSVIFILGLSFYLQHMVLIKGAYAANKEFALHLNEQDMVLHFANFQIGKTTLIQIGDQGVLMDIGDATDVRDLLNYMQRQGIKKITKVFLTNWTKENSGGLIKLVEEFPQAEIYVPELTADNYGWLNGQEVHKVKAGDHIFLSDSGISFDILSPLPPLFNDVYNDSLIGILHYNKIKVLLTSDIREEAEERLLFQYPNLKAEIMTVPDRPTGVLHSQGFIKKINPQTAVMVEMPCGECKQVVKDAANRYSQEWSDFFFIPIGKNLKILFKDGAYTTPKNQLE